MVQQIRLCLRLSKIALKNKKRGKAEISLFNLAKQTNVTAKNLSAWSSLKFHCYVAIFAFQLFMIAQTQRVVIIVNVSCYISSDR